MARTATAASQTKGWLRRTHVVQHIAPHSLPTPRNIPARPVHKVSGKADAVLQFARDQNLRFAQETRFGEELHVMVDLSYAVTFYKVQGFSLEKIITDMTRNSGMPLTFTQLYVAVSRSRTRNKGVRFVP